MESTNHFQLIKEAKDKGYLINLTFLWLLSPDLAVKGCVEKLRMLRFSQIWSSVFKPRAKEIATELPLSERQKKWRAKDV